ncbi:MAG: hypothetical protein ABL973_06830 [Micropepsaceae bacterium]
MTTDKDIAAMLSRETSRPDAAFRMRVISQLCIRSERTIAFRRALVVTGVFALIGLAFATMILVGVMPDGIEALAIAACLTVAAYELAMWLTEGHSLLAGQLRWFRW